MSAINRLLAMSLLTTALLAAPAASHQRGTLDYVPTPTNGAWDNWVASVQVGTPTGLVARSGP